ncbi:GNAT family N-acetyltransferase [Chitinimonas arctica]|uniref:GNAT family N-acetyltransferase n=1 Tax=Chitinimonas arctica TaxID=2594795 RepID=A0A516SA72_9NEIS|nr:GNAT family N-acetyltransferase [Chitinimonas arctica]QDQ25050.1 GNAT family N-acetyltransferase [Chitinimonas arctica]
MLVQIDLADTLLALELLQVQRVAYQQEAELIGYPALPPLRETLPELLDCGETVLGWRVDGELRGAVGYLAQAGQADICRLVVAPAWQRQGIARQLLQALIDNDEYAAITVTTAAANLPALALYREMGFLPSTPFTTPDGLALVRLQRGPAPDRC